MNIRTLFLELTKETTVPKYENGIESFLKYILPNYYTDSFGNIHCHVGGESNVLFVAHLDNYCESVVKVNHKFEDDYILTDRKSILGADDKAGVSLLLYMIHHNVPGHYSFFKAEEIGCLGSMNFKKEFNNNIKYNHCVAFDRRGFSDIITCQNNINTASNDFADFLSNEFKRLSKSKINYGMCDKGGVTDSGSFKYLIPECVNLSVGYIQNHTIFEKQNIEFLKCLANTVIKIDWQNLPTFREIPNFKQIAQLERIAMQNEIKQIEKELGFSLY